VCQYDDTSTAILVSFTFTFASFTRNSLSFTNFKILKNNYYYTFEADFDKNLEIVDFEVQKK